MECKSGCTGMKGSGVQVKDEPGLVFRVLGVKGFRGLGFRGLGVRV